MFRGGAATSAEETNTELSCFLCEEGEIFRRGFRIDDPVADALGETGIGHGREGHADAVEFAYHREQVLRANRAVGADSLNIFLLQLFPGVLRAHAAHRGAFLGVSHFGNDGKIREGANRVDCGEEFVEIAESFDEEEIDATLFESAGLLFENREYLIIRQIADLTHDAEWSD